MRNYKWIALVLSSSVILISNNKVFCATELVLALIRYPHVIGFVLALVLLLANAGIIVLK